MTRHSLVFHIARGVLVGFVGGLALGLTLIFVVSASASAQTAACQSHDNITKLLEEGYAERPVAAGLESGGRLVELFVSRDSTSWTLVTTTPTGMSCVIAVGEHWLETKTPAVEGPEV